MDVLTVFGPPGTGKTTRMLSIMEREFAAGVAPERLAYLTFTVAARAEAKHRALEKFGFTADRLRWVRTLHSTAYAALGIKKGMLVSDEGNFDAFRTGCPYPISTAGYVNEEDGTPVFGAQDGDRMLAFDHLRRSRLQSVDRAMMGMGYAFTPHEVRAFCDNYAAWKRREGLLDFTDLLERIDERCVLDCEVVIVDEAQDLSPLQWRALWHFAANARRVYIAGDDDQAIYTWAGADPHALLEQRGEVEVLPVSYRLPRRIWQLANGIIEAVRVRQPKRWQPRAAEGSVVTVPEVDRLELPPDGTLLVLYRTRRFRDDFERYLRDNGQPFLTQNGSSSIKDSYARAIVAWTRLGAGRTVAAEEVENILGCATQHRISRAQRKIARSITTQEYGAAELIAAGWPELMFSSPWFNVLDKLTNDVPYLRRVIERFGPAGLFDAPRVRLSTIHGSKGAEADHVWLRTDLGYHAERELDVDPDPERRVWYVGTTRAHNTLTLVGGFNPLLGVDNSIATR